MNCWILVDLAMWFPIDIHGEGEGFIAPKTGLWPRGRSAPGSRQEVIDVTWDPGEGNIMSSGKSISVGFIAALEDVLLLLKRMRSSADAELRGWRESGSSPRLPGSRRRLWL